MFARIDDEFVKVLAASGAKVALCARRMDRLEAPFVGRATELRTLKEALAATSAAMNGAVSS